MITWRRVQPFSAYPATVTLMSMPSVATQLRTLFQPEELELLESARDVLSHEEEESPQLPEQQNGHQKTFLL